MNLVLLEDVNGKRRVICEAPENIFSSSRAMRFFLRFWAGKIFGGQERDKWLLSYNPNHLAPYSVNQLIPHGTGGQKDFGMQLIIE